MIRLYEFPNKYIHVGPLLRVTEITADGYYKYAPLKNVQLCLKWSKVHAVCYEKIHKNLPLSLGFYVLIKPGNTISEINKTNFDFHWF